MSADFAGLRRHSVVHSLVSTRAFCIVGAGLFALCSPGLAQQSGQFRKLQSANLTLGEIAAAPERTQLFGTLHKAYERPAAITFTDGDPFSFARTFAWTEATPNGFLPFFVAEELERPAPVDPAKPRPDDRPVDFLPKFDYARGEVGVFYGKSISGKSDREVKQGYIIGEVGNETTHISVGASYLESSGRFPKPRP